MDVAVSAERSALTGTHPQMVPGALSTSSTWKGEGVKKLMLLTLVVALVAAMSAVMATAYPAPPDPPSAASVDRVPQGGAGTTECCPTASAPRPAQGHRIGTGDE